MGRSGFRLGSGARSRRPRSTATASKCFRPAHWLIAGAFMFASVTANMQVNDPQGFTISMDSGKNHGNYPSSWELDRALPQRKARLHNLKFGPYN